MKKEEMIRDLIKYQEYKKGNAVIDGNSIDNKIDDYIDLSGLYPTMAMDYINKNYLFTDKEQEILDARNEIFEELWNFVDSELLELGYSKIKSSDDSGIAYIKKYEEE